MSIGPSVFLYVKNFHDRGNYPHAKRRPISVSLHHNCNAYWNMTHGGPHKCLKTRQHSNIRNTAHKKVVSNKAWIKQRSLRTATHQPNKQYAGDWIRLWFSPGWLSPEHTSDLMLRSVQYYTVLCMY